jgi:hypothetical protein
MSGERRCFRREDEAGGVSKPGGGGGAIRLYSADTPHSVLVLKKNIHGDAGSVALPAGSGPRLWALIIIYNYNLVKKSK